MSNLSYFHKFSYYDDVIEIIIKDGSRKVLYKNKTNISNKKRVMQILLDLRKFGVYYEDAFKRDLPTEDYWFK